MKNSAFEPVSLKNATNACTSIIMQIKIFHCKIMSKLTCLKLKASSRDDQIIQIEQHKNKYTCA